ncbi:bis(5'-nucleosyl)-tetraphosphatase [asymmetrical] isoform X2 [Onthophagus taurus]|nr:bis(5'-nucleosyl)-tetraphosphatase [asymmetrical] isoform X2 [Onthophagus taurus]XP_022920745.1 bis(5'-nucleosyl)-tetraphosphatase [asymmetrical] isoform X2 [Onthophagus taurus]XP_022920746.1 bis(5'-nucleosyl)-tetraphosphatase [asymmetrical] isoform X2 [Onthophagus taurus]XP_022920747.1 bis(5'-nucleosyl)-tetraphosphatase [asymmetrical] isoform X2 [Onthophagus taurus]
MPKLAAGFVIFRRVSSSIEYLLLQTSYGEHHWTPPKGHLDPGETDIIAAYRETEEEAGFKKTDLKVFEDSKKCLNYEVKGRPKTVTYWLAELIDLSSNFKLSHEHQDGKWLELEEACRYANYSDMQGLLKYYDEFIKAKL